MSMDASGNPHERCKLIIYQSHGNSNQKWRFVPDGLGNFSIVNGEYNATLEIPDHSTAQPGTQCHVSQPNNTINEKWKVDRVNGGFSIRSAHNGLALSIKGGSCKNEDKVAIWNFENSPYDTWNILPN